MFRPIVICGPTASGKSALAMILAARFGGEIVSADSMQIYRGLDIGTAKPSAHERELVRHHMIDVVDTSEAFSAARYSEMASAAVDDILKRRKLPIICGGTGLYINALINGGSFACTDEDSALRASLETQYYRRGGQDMLAQLAAVDAETAARLYPNDKRRIVRALEVYQLTGLPISEHNRISKARPPRYDAEFIGIKPASRELLYARINDRVDEMLALGLENEVRELMEQGSLVGTAAQAIGYKEMLAYLRGEATRADAVDLIKRKTRNYAKRQLTWFEADKRIKWVITEKNHRLDDLFQNPTSFS